MRKEGSEEVEFAKRRCRDVIERIESLPTSTNITDSSRQTLLKMVQSELAFLYRCSSSSPPISVNIGHLEAVINILQHPLINGVSRVCKPIPTSSYSIRSRERIDSKIRLRGVYVDIVCTLNRNPVWIIVSDRKPQYISWHKGHKTKGLKCRIMEVLDAARKSQILKPCSIILFFSNGLNRFVLQRLREEFGASNFDFEFSVFDFDFSENVEDWIYVLARSYREACALEIKVEEELKDIHLCSECNAEKSGIESGELEFFQKRSERDLGDTFSSVLQEMKSYTLDIEVAESINMDYLLCGGDDLINFDTTALIALVSGISNGCTEKLLATSERELKQRFKGNYDFVIEQATSEIKKPILMELSGVLSGKRGILCESAHSEFKELVLMCGGPDEKSRADQLLKRLMVVPDSPSERMMCLPTTRKLALKNKLAFGTGDHWRAPTLTANMAFVRAVSQTGMSLYTIQHRPRALTGD